MKLDHRTVFEFRLVVRLRYHKEIPEDVRVTSKLSTVDLECNLPCSQDYISVLKPEIIRMQQVGEVRHNLSL
jgi:hypothetical protein